MISRFDEEHIEDKDIINACPIKKRYIHDTRKAIQRSMVLDSCGVFQYSYGFVYGLKIDGSAKTSKRDGRNVLNFLQGEDG